MANDAGTQWSVSYEVKIYAPDGRQSWAARRELHGEDEDGARQAALHFEGTVDRYRNIKVQSRAVPDWADVGNSS